MSKAAAEKSEGLSAQTLAIASLASLAAAIVVHKIWQGGAIVGAAVTPVIVAVVSEALRKPAQVIQTTRTARTRGAAPRDPGLPPATHARPSEDRFGIWEAERPPLRERLNRTHLKVAIATGLVAFAIVAFFLTGAELVFGGADSGDKFRIVPGTQEKRDRDTEKKQPAETEPTDEEQSQTAPQGTVTVTTPAPEEQTPTTTAPATTPPAATTPQEGEQPPPGGEQAPLP